MKRAGKLSWRSLSSSAAAFSNPKTRKGTASPLAVASVAVPLRPGPAGSCWGLVLGYWPEEEPGLRPDEAAQGAGFVPFKVWARTEDAA